MKRSLKIIILTGILALQNTAADSKGANKVFDRQKAVIVHADSISYDYDHGIVIARGGVVFYHQEQTLKADVVNYNQQTNMVTASGNVSITHPTQDVFFANYLELSDDMKNGFINEIKVLLSDDSKLAATTAKQFDDGTQTQLNKAVYTACKVCREEPGRAPLWQIKSETVLWAHKEGEHKDIMYTDATMEIFGVPIFWTPYFRHPDPTVKRRSGLLAPIIGSTPATGFGVMSPYFYEWDDNKDLTFKPLVTAKGGFMLDTQYRQHFSKGKVQLEGSLSRSKRLVHGRAKESTRWHVDSHLRHDLDDNWRMGTDVVRASDQTYLREFAAFTDSSKKFIDPKMSDSFNSVYTSKIYAEGFKNRSYANISSMAFQGVRDGDSQNTIPLVLPMVDVNYLSNPYASGAKLHWNNHFANLQRRKGTNVRSLSSDVGSDITFNTPLGGVNTIGASMRGDVYQRDNFKPNGAKSKSGNGAIGRAFPQAILEWKYPFMKPMDDGQVVVEPLVNIIGAPKVGNQSKIPNEDSFIIEPTDLSFFNGNRFPGYDIIDDGSRFNYGLNIDGFDNDWGSLGTFFGQTYAFAKPSIAQRFASNVEEHWSDFIGRVNYMANKYVDFNYRFSLDKDNFKHKRNELAVSAGVDAFRVNADYILLPRYRDDTQSQGVEQIDLGVSSLFTEHWTAKIGTTQELGKNKGALAHNAGLIFENECLKFETVVTKSFYRDRDLKPGKSIMFKIVFATLGGITFKPDLSSPSPATANDRDTMLKRNQEVGV